jgi:hypothetical protein
MWPATLGSRAHRRYRPQLDRRPRSKGSIDSGLSPLAHQQTDRRHPRSSAVAADLRDERRLPSAVAPAGVPPDRGGTKHRGGARDRPRSHISTEIVTHEPWPAFAVNVPSPSSRPASHATVGVHAEAGSLVGTTPRSARRICARRTPLISGASSSIRRIAGLPLIEVTYERLWLGFRGTTAVTARPRTRAERSTTSRSHISRRIEGYRGDEGTGRRNEPSPSSRPASHWRSSGSTIITSAESCECFG